MKMMKSLLKEKIGSIRKEKTIGLTTVKETMRKVNIEELSIEVKKRKKTDLKKIETIIGKIITKEKKELMNGLRRKSQKEKRNKYHMPMKVDPKNQISERTRID
jgi:hypothetical protein